MKVLLQSEISETLNLNNQELVSIGLGLENHLYPSLSLDHQEFPSLRLRLETETKFLEPLLRSRKLKLTFKSLGLILDNCDSHLKVVNYLFVYSLDISVDFIF